MIRWPDTFEYCVRKARLQGRWVVRDNAMISTSSLVAVFSILTFLIAIPVLSFGRDPAADVPLSASATDNICGARCTQFVLQTYGKHEDLAGLVDELADGPLTNGTSLLGIQNALGRRGIFATAWNIDPDVAFDLSWEHPVIIHLQGADSSLGHFVVKVPDKNALWDGLQGFRRLQDFNAPASGNILLTSSDPIRVPEFEFNFNRRYSSTILALFSVGMVFFISIFVIRGNSIRHCLRPFNVKQRG